MSTSMSAVVGAVDDDNVTGNGTGCQPERVLQFYFFTRFWLNHARKGGHPGKMAFGIRRAHGELLVLNLMVVFPNIVAQCCLENLDRLLLHPETTAP
eukprot:200062-Amphidinium_carterae.2